MATLADYPVPWVFQNLNDGEGSNVNKRADGERVMDNLYAVADYIFFGEAEGANADDNGSDANTCRLILKTDDGDTGIIEAGDFFMVIDQNSANVWSSTCLVNNQITFSDTEMDKGTVGVVVYNNASLRTNLYVAIYKRNPCWNAANISRDATMQDAFTFDKMETSAGAACEARYETVRTDVYNVLDAAGLLDETVGAAQLSEELFSDESRGNFWWGDLGRNSGRNTGGPALPDQITEWNAPGGAALDGTHAFLGDLSLMITANVGGGGGAKLAIDTPWQSSDFQGQYVAGSAKVYSNTIDGVQIGIDDGVNPITWSAAGPAAANQWLSLTVVHECDAAATECSLVARATQVGVIFWLDAVGGTFGTTPHQYTPNETQRVVYKDQDNNYVNLALWSDFELQRNAANTTSLGDCWFSGSTGVMPNGWIASGVLANYPDYYNTDSYEKDGCMRLRLVLGEYIYHWLGYAGLNPVVEYIRGKPLTAAFWIKRLGAGAQPIYVTARISYQVGTVVTNTDKDYYIDDMANWTRCAVTVDEIPAAATNVGIYLMHNDAGAAGFDILVDAEMLTASLYAVDYQPTTIWNEIEYVFSYPGALIAGQYFNLQQIQGASYSLKKPTLVWGAHFREEAVGVAPGSDSVEVRNSQYTTGVGWAEGTSVNPTIAGGAVFEESWALTGAWNWLETGDRLRARVLAICAGAAGQSATLTAYGARFGI